MERTYIEQELSLLGGKAIAFLIKFKRMLGLWDCARTSSSAVAMHYGSFASLPSPNVEIELSGANPTHRALCPITFEPTLENVYMYHRPQAMTYSEEERHIRDTEAETWRNLYRDDPEAACHTHSFTSSQTAVIRVGDHGYFEVHNGPLHTLEPGMHIVCFGDMVGDWFSTSRMKRHKHTGYTSWEWVNHKAEICTIVQVPNQYVRPWTIAERMKKFIRRVRRFGRRPLEME
ncbi:hypothetical protein C8R47DRAFT_1084602 [Mycena vitilis]|nr:hypothetical protein C8R47DRAFT_1084602 [Mycena vitilis]